MYSMKEACGLVGMSYENLKYYCNEGLVPHVKRGANRYRYFDDQDIAWIRGLSCLKKCGMGIAEMKRYTALCLEGESSIPERKRMLEAKRLLLRQRQKELEECMNYIQAKQQYYDDVLSGKSEYLSNLIGNKEGSAAGANR